MNFMFLSQQMPNNFDENIYDIRCMHVGWDALESADVLRSVKTFTNVVLTLTCRFHHRTHRPVCNILWFSIVIPWVERRP